MTRRLDDTKVGEYKINWFFELIQLAISILGCVAVFLLPITYNVVNRGDAVEMKGLAPVSYLFSNPENGFTKLVSIAIVVFFGVLLLNIFAILAIPKVNKSVYVKISNWIEGLIAIVCLCMLAYYMIHLFNTNAFATLDVRSMYTVVMMYMIIIDFALINSIFMYFNSKKVSIYD